MAPRILISYRRDDSAAAAGRVNDRLEQEFGRESLFMDVDTIPLGVDFVEVLSAEVAKCDVLLAIIGPNWLKAKGEGGSRRLDSEFDFVRIEIAAALKRNIPVIPILLDGTRMPKSDGLPDELKSLAHRNALDVRHASFRSDVERLVRGLRASAPRTGRINIDAPIVHGAPDGWFNPGAGKSEWFKDHALGPEMVVVPAGEFAMGSSESQIAALYKQYETEDLYNRQGPQYKQYEKEDWHNREGPQHVVRIKAPFAAGRYAVTFDEWDACIGDGGCKGYRPSDQGWGRGKRPVINVSIDDAMTYVEWQSRKTGKIYRLLSEAEWEYVARSGMAASFWWGETISTGQANYDGNCTFRGGAKGEYRKKTVAVDSFEPNPWGFYNMHGNVWEWCEDLWHKNYEGAPTDGLVWLQGGDAASRVVRGGAWNNIPQSLRSANRIASRSDSRFNFLGFRVARTL
jgi:formylglycine-generating enzyme required for sulfatase activity